MSTSDLATGAGSARPVGVLAGSGRLGEVLLHGVPLVSHARRGLRDAGVEVLATDSPWNSLVTRGHRTVSGTRNGECSSTLVVHDPMCPLTPAAFISSLVDAALTSGAVQVGVRPVTDTIKSVAHDIVGRTVDRELLLAIASPVVLAPPVVAALPDWPDTDDFANLVRSLRELFPVQFVEVPAMGRRVEDLSAVRLLEAFAELHPA